MADRDQLKVTFDSGGHLGQQARPEYSDDLYDELVRLTNLRSTPGPKVNKLARNLR